MNVLTRPVRQIRIVLEMIKFEHTVFALPFTLSSALVAAGGLPEWRVTGWILVAVVGARTAAMGFNRIADARFDALNPRTVSRAIPSGLVSVFWASVLVVVSASLMVLAAYELNHLAFSLSPVALAAVLGYSYSKRFTSLSHLWLGLCLGIAPVGAWIAVTGTIGVPSLVLSFGVALWTAGFDIIYALQDADFDRSHGLHSIPAWLGSRKALALSQLSHVVMISMLVVFGLLCKLETIYYLGVACVTGFLIYEHRLVSPNDISRIDTAFFTLNGFVSLGFLAFVVLDVLL